jgi:hypothetical protein
VRRPSPLQILRWAYVAFIAVASGAAVRSALAGTGEGRHPPACMLVLDALELIAAVALLIRPAERIACGVLVAIYVIAGVVSVAAGAWLAPQRLFYYAATAMVIVAAGRSPNRPAMARPAPSAL